MKIGWLMAALLLASSGTAGAAGHYADGNSLHEWKQEYDRAMTGRGSPEDDASGAKLRYYILGVVDGLSATRRLCVEGANTTQMIEMVLQYVAANPAEWQLSGAILVSKALKGTFGCPKK